MDPSATTTADAPAPPRARLAAALVVAAATLLAYSNTFDASFHFDDFGLIVEPARLHDLANLWPPSGRRWVGDLTFALNHRLGGLEVLGYHLVNVAIHVSTALAVAALAGATLRTPAARAGRVGPLVRGWLPLAAGLLFALHPLATQAVTYVIQRYASLATLLYLLSLLSHVEARLALDADGRVTRRVAARLALSVAAGAAAMATKEISVTLPLVAAGYELLFLRAPRRLLLLLPLAATTALPFLDPLLGQHLASEAPLSPWAYALTQTRVVVTYLRLLVLPVGQNLDHDVRLSRALGEPEVLLSLSLLLTLAALGGWLVVRARRTGRVEGLLAGGGIAWFFATLSVESSVLPIRDVLFEHRVYLPCVGAAIAFGTALLAGVERLRLPGRPAVGAAVALALVAAPLGLATHRRNAVWRDELTLWRDAAEKSPDKARPRQFHGTALFEAGALDAAERELLAAVRLQPDYLDALYNLGNLYAAQGRFAQAADAFARAVRAAPGHAMARNNLGAARQRLGDLEGAAAAYQEALRLDPGLAMARNNLALVRRQQGAAGR